MMASIPELPLTESFGTEGGSAMSSESPWQHLLDGPSIDLQQLLENCLGMPMFAVSLLDEFARTSENRVTAFTERFKEANLPAIAELAHALKGVSGIIGARSLRELTIDLERACREEDLRLTAQLVDTLLKGLRQVQHDIPGIKQSLLARMHRGK